MLRLILMRHAKSSWDSAAQSDHERPLNERGRRAAARMGRWLQDGNLMPRLALVSSATRTQETWERMALPVAMQTRSALYEADGHGVLDVIQGAPDEATSLLVLGHQPSMQECANRLLEDGFISDYPTAKITVIGFGALDWRSVSFGTGRLIAEAAPRELA